MESTWWYFTNYPLIVNQRLPVSRNLYEDPEFQSRWFQYVTDQFNHALAPAIADLFEARRIQWQHWFPAPTPFLMKDGRDKYMGMVEAVRQVRIFQMIEVRKIVDSPDLARDGIVSIDVPRMIAPTDPRSLTYTYEIRRLIRRPILPLSATEYTNTPFLYGAYDDETMTLHLSRYQREWEPTPETRTPIIAQMEHAPDSQISTTISLTDEEIHELANAIIQGINHESD